MSPCRCGQLHPRRSIRVLPAWGSSAPLKPEGGSPYGCGYRLFLVSPAVVGASALASLGF